MTSRIKRTTIFKKNHIEIIREDYPTKILVPGVSYRPSGSYDHSYYWNPRYYKEKEVKLKSPLGFWYTKRIKVYAGDKKGKPQKSWDGKVYEISYSFRHPLFEHSEGIYYLKNGEITDMDSYFYTHFTAGEIRNLFGLNVYERWNVH